MTKLPIVLAALWLAITPAAAQQTPDTEASTDASSDHLGEDMSKEMEELSDSARQFFTEFLGILGPKLKSLRSKIDDLNKYDPPEMLPNGDIIIRRKPATDPSTTPPSLIPDDQVDL